MKRVTTAIIAVIIIAAAPLSAQSKSAGAPADRNKPENTCLKLRTAPAPFLPSGDGAEICAQPPVIKDKKIIFGCKELAINENGGLSITSGGKELAKLYFHFHTYDLIWPNEGKIKPVSFKKEGNNFLFSMKIPVDKAGSETLDFQESVSVLDDGRINLQTQWSAPAGAKIAGSQLWLEFPAALLVNEIITVDGKEFIVPENDKTGFFMELNPAGITVCPDKPDRTLSLELKECRMAFGRSSGGQVYIKLKGIRDGQKLNIVLDLRKGQKAGAPPKSGKTFAGIDLKAVEDLETPDFSSSRNLIRNPSFEQGFKDCVISASYCGRVADDANYGSYAIDDKTSKFGERSLKIKAWSKCAIDPVTGRRTPGNISLLPVPVEPGAYTLSFYVRSERSDSAEINVWCSAAGGEIFGARAFKAASEWKRHAMTFEAKQSMPPLAVINLNAVSKTGDGHVWIDGVQFERGSSATEFSTRPAEGFLTTSGPGNFIGANDKINAKLEIISAPGNEGAARVTAKTFFGDSLYEGNFNFKCGSDGKAAVSLPLDGKLPPGVNIIKAEYSMKDGAKTYDHFRIAVMSFLENKHRLKNIFSINYTDIVFRADTPQILERWRKTGIGAKPHLSWWDTKYVEMYNSHGVEVTDAYMSDVSLIKENGEYRFVIISNLKYPQAGAKILIKDYRCESKDGKLTDDYLRRFEEAVEKNVRDYPAVRTWSFSCEDNAKYPDWAGVSAKDEEFDNYAKLNETFYRAVKKADPAAKVANSAPSNINPQNGIKFIDRLLGRLNGKIKYDLIGAHIYRYKPESPDLDADAECFFRMLDRHGYKDTPVIWPEGMHYGPYEIPAWGISSHGIGGADTWIYGALSYDMGWTEKVSAAWYARTWLVAFKYSDRVVTATAGSNFNNFEIDADLTPFAMQKIPNTLGNLLGDSKFLKDIRFAPYTRCYVFEDAQKRPVAAVWNYHPKVDAGTARPPEAQITLKELPAPEIFDLMEIRRVPEIKDGRINFPMSSFPLFFRGKPGSSADLVKMFDEAYLTGSDISSPLSLAAKPESSDSAVISLKNILSKEFKGSVTVSGQEFNISVPPSGSSSVKIKLPLRLSEGAVTDEHLAAKIASENSKFASDLSFTAFIIRKKTGEIVIGAESDAWRDIPEIKLKNRFLRNAPGPVSDADFSAGFKAAWDNAGLYLRVTVRDDKFTHEEFKSPEARWENDSLQIYFDTLCDARQKESENYDDNDYDYAVFPSALGDKSVVYRYRSPDPQLTLATQAPPDNSVANDIPSAFSRTPDGYVYEVFFPAKYLLPAVLSPGACIGMGVLVNDKDDGAKVRSSLTITPPGTECWNNPRLWPAALLVE